MSRQSDTNATPKKRLSTKARQKLFLEAFAEHANVLLAAQSAGINRTTVYKWLEHDADFSFAYNQAKEDAKDVLRAEIYRRAVQGWEEPIYQLKKFVGTVHKYDSTLLIFHAKMLMPEYREKSTVDVNASTNAQVQDTQALYDAVERVLAPYPEAKWKLAEAIAELGKTSKS